MSDISLVLTDMDGTIVIPGKHEVSERVREAIIACENQGVLVVPVTGRPYEMAKNVMEILGFDDLCVLDGGASIRRVMTGELVWSQWIDPETLQAAMRAVLPFAKEIIDYYPTQIEVKPEMADPEAIDWSAPYIFAPVLDQDVAEAEAALSKIPGIVTHSNPEWSGGKHLTGLQITHEAADKFHGVAALLELTGKTKDQTLAIGDSNNDLPLFKSAGTRIAMGNATARLKAEADHIVATVADDGFAEAMQRFVLLAVR